MYNKRSTMNSLFARTDKGFKIVGFLRLQWLNGTWLHHSGTPQMRKIQPGYWLVWGTYFLWCHWSMIESARLWIHPHACWRNEEHWQSELTSKTIQGQPESTSTTITCLSSAGFTKQNKNQSQQKVKNTCHLPLLHYQNVFCPQGLSKEHSKDKFNIFQILKIRALNTALTRYNKRLWVASTQIVSCTIFILFANTLKWQIVS